MFSLLHFTATRCNIYILILHDVAAKVNYKIYIPLLFLLLHKSTLPCFFNTFNAIIILNKRGENKMNKRLKNLPISKRLFFTFGVILVVFFTTVALAVFGLFSTGKNFDSFYNESYTIADKASTLKADLEIVAKYIGYSMMEEDVEKTAEYIEAAKDTISELREGTTFMKENLKQPENLNLIEKYDTVMKTIMEERDMVFELAGQNKNTEAVELYFNKVRPT